MPNQPPSRPKNGPQSDPGASGLPEGRRVQCAKLGRELPGLPAPPFQTPLGQRIYDSISLEAWSQWLQHSQMFINERELRLSDPESRRIWLEECERFLFGGGSTPPPGWVPPTGFVRLTKKKSSDE